MKQLQKPELLIGSSITRDIRSTDSDKLHIITLSGACIRNVANTLSGVRGKYSRVTIQVGSNDCADRETTAEEMTEQYRRMVRGLQDGATETTISAVLPRCNDETANERIASLNAGLQTVADDMACAFIPHADFTMNSGKPNDGYYLDDGVHLSKRGSERLIADLQLEKAATQKRNVNSSSRVPCENCGESNHNENKCRFSYDSFVKYAAKDTKVKYMGFRTERTKTSITIDKAPTKVDALTSNRTLLVITRIHAHASTEAGTTTSGALTATNTLTHHGAKGIIDHTNTRTAAVTPPVMTRTTTHAFMGLAETSETTVRPTPPGTKSVIDHANTMTAAVIDSVIPPVMTRTTTHASTGRVQTSATTDRPTAPVTTRTYTHESSVIPATAAMRDRPTPPMVTCTNTLAAT